MTVDTKGPASMTQPYFQRPVVFATSCLLALGLLFAAYSNHFQNGFHFDDSHVIEDNLYIRSLNQIPKFFVDATTFSSLPLNAPYRLLLSASYAIDYRLAGGLDPWQFHITQFLMLVCLGVSATYLLAARDERGRSAVVEPLLGVVRGDLVLPAHGQHRDRELLQLPLRLAVDLGRGARLLHLFRSGAGETGPHRSLRISPSDGTSTAWMRPNSRTKI